MKHCNIPVFVPHKGCPNTCVFCNQRSISGTDFGGAAEADLTISRALESIEAQKEKRDVQVAFFGGSFTGIEEELMVKLLATAKKYIDEGRVRSVRLSTRPDYIDAHKLDILKKFGVSDIELGVQSMDDEVLSASRRGHTSFDTVRSAGLIKEYGFNLILQMMTGLPGSDRKRELYTAKRIAELRPDGVRIYPTVVFFDTELCEMAKRGEYHPVPLQRAVEDAADVTLSFIRAGIPVIRTGLQSHEGMNPGKIYGGPYHPALGEMVQSAVYYRIICEKLSETALLLPDVTILAAKGETSKVLGQRRCNAERIQRESGVKLFVRESEKLEKYEIVIS